MAFALIRGVGTSSRYGHAQSSVESNDLMSYWKRHLCKHIQWDAFAKQVDLHEGWRHSVPLRRILEANVGLEKLAKQSDVLELAAICAYRSGEGDAPVRAAIFSLYICVVNLLPGHFLDEAFAWADMHKWFTNEDVWASPIEAHEAAVSFIADVHALQRACEDRVGLRRGGNFAHSSFLLSRLSASNFSHDQTVEQAMSYMGERNEMFRDRRSLGASWSVLDYCEQLGAFVGGR